MKTVGTRGGDTPLSLEGGRMIRRWEKHVPKLYHSIIKCYCEVKGSAFQSTSDVVVVCTLGGQIIEFSNMKTLKTCDINDYNTEHIFLFTSYNPHIVYYVVKSLERVYIIAREITLKVMDVYKEVEMVEVDDFNGTGVPQIGIWYKNKIQTNKPHFTTDFCDTETQHPVSSSEFSDIYNTRLQECKLRLAEVQQQLKLRRELRLSLSYSLIQKQIKNTLVPEMICVLGEEDEDEDGYETPRILCIEVRKTWQKVYNNRWILGVHLINKHERSGVDVKFLLMSPDGDPIAYKTCLYGKKRSRGQMFSSEEITAAPADLERLEVIGPRSAATVIAILEPRATSRNDVITVNGIITYKLQDETASGSQIPIPDFHLSVMDLANGSFAPFQTTTDDCVEDILSIRVCTEHFRLLTSAAVDNILTESLGFNLVSPPKSFYHKGNNQSCLSGLFVQIMYVPGKEYYLSVNAKDSSQAALLLCSLYSELPAGTIIDVADDLPTSSAMNMYKAVEEEINFTIKHMTEWREKFDDGSGSIRVSKSEYVQYRLELSKLEKETDLLCNED